VAFVPFSFLQEIFALKYHCDNYVLCYAGGVQEALLLEPGKETIYLRNRYGFVRCALEAGSPLVPVFCFGQSKVYHYRKPKGTWYNRLSRQLGFAPMIFWGMYGTPFPYPHPITIVVGKPIEVKKTSQPSREEVAVVLGKFIGAMEELFETHRSETAYKETQLTIL
jgi:1-acyl-sn-glycerol-3-phosphate acyltransferase